MRQQESQVWRRRPRNLQDVVIGRCETLRRKPAHSLVTRAISAPRASWTAQSHERQLSASIDPRASPPGPRSAKRFLPTTFSWSIAPRDAPPASRICIDDLSIAGEVSQAPSCRRRRTRKVGVSRTDPRRQRAGTAASSSTDLLADRPDLDSLWIEDAILVVHLDQLRFLTDHEHVAFEQASHEQSLFCLRTA
jgi:hypothetical protein